MQFFKNVFVLTIIHDQVLMCSVVSAWLVWLAGRVSQSIMSGVWLLAVVAAISEMGVGSVCPSVELTFNNKCYTFPVSELPSNTFSLFGGGFPFLVSGPCFAVKAPTICSTMDGDASPSPILGPDGAPGHCVSCGALRSATVTALVRDNETNS